jgi:integrase
MAVMKRGGDWYIYFRPFKDKKIGVKLDVATKTEAKGIEAMLTRACRTGDYTGLDPVSREACVRMFINQKWQLPPELGGRVVTAPTAELTLWKACELFMKYPETRAKNEKALVRYELSMTHLVRLLGKEVPLKALWVPELKQYQIERLSEGAAPNTINIELSCLSRIFAVMIEMRLLDANPCRQTKRLSTKSNEREVYLSLETVQAIADECPTWYQRYMWCAFYTGMRRGELIRLTRKQVNLGKRIISLRPEDTKEGKPKRIPVHGDLVPILAEAMSIPYLLSDRVFLVQDHKGIRPPGVDTVDNPWARACKILGFDPHPRFHDLRHTWRTNARRSGMDYQIAESIMGHWHKGKSVNDRYGRISDDELLQAIDRMTFDHGKTEIVVPQKRHQKKVSGKNGNKMETRLPMKEQRPRVVGA